MNYYLTGPDGSGKTTYLKEIEDLLNKREEQTQHIWIRSPKIFSKPLMAYCRLVSLTKYQYIDGIRYGGHEFYRSKLVSWLFPILQLVDFKIKWFFKKRKINNNQIVLFDRFVLDTLADLMVDTHRFDLHKKWVGKKFLSLLNNNIKIVVLKVTTERIKTRKLDTKYDPHTETKNKVYSILATDLNLQEVNNDRKIDEVKEIIINEFNLF